MTTKVVTDEQLGKFAKRIKPLFGEEKLDFNQTMFALQKLIEGKRLIEDSDFVSHPVSFQPKAITDSWLGKLVKRTRDLQTRLEKGAIDYHDTMYGLKLLSAGKPVVEAPILAADLEKQLIGWRDFYREVFQLEVSFFGQRIPPQKSGLNRMNIEAQEISLERILSKCLDRGFRIEGFPNVGELAKQVDSVRSAKNSASITWISQSAEADEPLPRIQDFDYTKEGSGFITLEERLIAELEHNFRTGECLDQRWATVCLGSRHSTGQIPLVLAINHGNEVQVTYSSAYWINHVTSLRTRRVQS